MSFLIGIEIDNSHVAWMHSPDGKGKSRLNLTTLSDYQHTAILNFYVKTDSRKIRLISETINNIPPAKAGDPLITVESELVKRRMNYSIYLNNRFIRKSTVKIPKEAVKKDRSVIIPVSIAAVIILLLFALFLLPVSPLSIFSSDSIFSAGRNRSSVSETRKQAQTSIPDRKIEDTTPATAKPAVTKPEISRTAEEKTAEAEQLGRQQTSPEKTEEAPVITQEKPTEEPATAPEPAPPVPVTIVIDKQLTVNFLPDNADLTAEARNKIIEFVKQLPTGDNTDLDMIQIDITGHCARFGTESGRVELSEARAANTREFLLSIWKVPTDAKIEGYGAARPVTMEKDKQYLNRRAEIHITGSVTEEPIKQD